MVNPCYKITVIDVPNVRVYKIVGAFLAELFGSLLLILFGCMGLTFAPEFYFLTTLNFGLILMILTEAFRYISGGIFNPAITLCAYICGKIRCCAALCYCIAQIIGAICGYALLMVLVPDIRTKVSGGVGVCISLPSVHVSSGGAFAIEFFSTWLLAWVYCSQWCTEIKVRNDSLSLRIGIVFGILVSVCEHFTGGSMNPARSLAAAIFNNTWTSHWIYWVATLCGSIIGSIVFKITYNLACTTKYLKTQKYPKL